MRNIFLTILIVATILAGYMFYESLQPKPLIKDKHLEWWSPTHYRFQGYKLDEIFETNPGTIPDYNTMQENLKEGFTWVQDGDDGGTIYDKHGFQVMSFSTVNIGAINIDKDSGELATFQNNTYVNVPSNEEEKETDNER